MFWKHLKYFFDERFFIQRKMNPLKNKIKTNKSNRMQCITFGFHYITMKKLFKQRIVRPLEFLLLINALHLNFMPKRSKKY